MILAPNRSFAPLTLNELRGNLTNLFQFEESDLVPDQHGRVLYSGGVQAWRARFHYAGPNGKERLSYARQEAITKTWDAVMMWGHKDLTTYEQAVYVTQYVPFLKKHNDTRFTESIQRGKELRWWLLFDEFEQITGLYFPEKDFEEFVLRDACSETLQKWFKRLNECTIETGGFWSRYATRYGSLTLTLFYAVLKRLIPKGQREDVFWRLHLQGLELFQKSDFKYLEKRRFWIAEQFVSECKLLNSFPSTNADIKIFETENSRIVRIPDHCLRLRFEEIEWKKRWVDSRKEKDLGPPPVIHLSKFGFITKDGVQIAPKPSMVFEENLELVKELVITFVKDMFKNHYTPENLKANDLWLHEDSLLTIEMLTIDPFHLKRIVQFVQELLPDNFAQVMHESGIMETPEQNLFIRFIKACFLKKSVSVLNTSIARSKGWIDIQIGEFDANLGELFTYLHENIPAPNTTTLERAILKVYSENGLFGEFPEKYFSKVLEAFENPDKSLISK